MTYPRQKTTTDEARRVGEVLKVDWDQIDLEQFRRGMTSNSSTAGTIPRPM